MGTKDEKVRTDYFKQMVKHALWTCEAFHFTPQNALKYINMGMLGFKLDKNGNQIIIQGKPVPVTISRASYFKYKAEFTDLPQIYLDVREFGMKGYTSMMFAIKEELATLHTMTVEIMLSRTEAMEKLQVIESLVKNIIPTESAMADMLKKVSRHYKEETKEPPKGEEIARHQDDTA